MIRWIIGAVVLAGLGMGSGSGFSSGLRPGIAGGKKFAEHAADGQKHECHTLVLAHRMVRLRVRLTVFRLTLCQGGQAQDDWAQGS